MNSFHTKSSARRLMLTVLFTFIPMFLLAFLGLKIAVITWLYFEAVLALTFLFCFFLVAKTHWKIEFQGNSVHLFNTGNRRSYCIDNLTQSDLTIKQTPNQQKRNCCDIKIANTSFGFYDVERYDELIEYIQENIPKELNES